MTIIIVLECLLFMGVVTLTSQSHSAGNISFALLLPSGIHWAWMGGSEECY